MGRRERCQAQRSCRGENKQCSPDFPHKGTFASLPACMRAGRPSPEGKEPQPSSPPPNFRAPIRPCSPISRSFHRPVSCKPHVHVNLRGGLGRERFCSRFKVGVMFVQVFVRPALPGLVVFQPGRLSEFQALHVVASRDLPSFSGSSRGSFAHMAFIRRRTTQDVLPRSESSDNAYLARLAQEEARDDWRNKPRHEKVRLARIEMRRRKSEKEGILSRKFWTRDLFLLVAISVCSLLVLLYLLGHRSSRRKALGHSESWLETVEEVLGIV